LKVALIAVTALGCSTVQPPRYYAATATMIPVEEPSPPTDTFQKTVQNAGEILHKDGLFVGFVPPAPCRAGTASPGTIAAIHESQCQLLMTALEKAASDRGYRVLNWNQLQGDPYRAASEKNVDLLFVMEELSIRTPSSEPYEIAAVRFSELKSDSYREPYHMRNSLAVEARCKAEFAHQTRKMKSDTGEVTGMTMSVKLVSAQDGVSQWSYRHSVDREKKAALEKTEKDLYYAAQGHKTRGVGKIVMAGVFAGIGIASAVVGARLYEGGTSLVIRNVGVGLSWFTILPFAIAIPVGSVGIYHEAKAPVYDAPEDIVCRNASIGINPLLSPDEAAADEADSLSMKDETTLAATSSSGGAFLQKNDSYLVDELVTHFYTALNTLSREYVPPSEPPPDPSKSIIIDVYEEAKP
jgi:hypothetical protein